MTKYGSPWFASPEEASWPGTGLSTSWEFPVTRLAGTEPTLSITNPGDAALTVTIDVLTPEGPIQAARTVVDIESGERRIRQQLSVHADIIKGML